MVRERGRRRPGKHPDVLPRSRERIHQGRFRDTRHTIERRQVRDITILEIRQVIDSGYHEKSKDEYKLEWKAWNYALRGRTIDGRELRVAVSFDVEDVLLIITAIDLDKADW